MDTTLYYAFMDESGTVGTANGTHFLTLAVTAFSNPREVERPIRRAFHQAVRKYGRNKVNEVKASDFEVRVIFHLLSEIAEKDIRIVATIIDQSAIRVPPKDMEIFIGKQCMDSSTVSRKFSPS